MAHQIAAIGLVHRSRFGRPHVCWIDQRQEELPDKARQVMQLLRERSPDTVARHEIIERVWAGNYYTGEKGLHQALWQIRAALKDNARSPRFVRTVPRVGYCWLQPASSNKGFLPVRWRAGAAALLLLVVGVVQPGSISRLYPLGMGSEPPAMGQTASAEMIRGVHAYQVSEDIYVDMSNGCLRILKDSKSRDIGRPLLAADGRSVAFTATSANECKLITVELETGKQHDYGACPVTSAAPATTPVSTPVSTLI